LGRTNETGERVAVVVTVDGRRVHVPLPDDSIAQVSLLGIFRLLGQGVLSLITGSRREPDGRRSVRR
jgi:mitochondrial fission protein ELM1